MNTMCMRGRMRRYIFFFALIVLFGGVGTAHAQFSLPSLTSPVSLRIEPETPDPGSDITVRAQSFSMDLDRAFITWYVNGARRSEGTGVKEMTATVGPVGSRTNIVAVVNDGAARAERTIRPTAVDILWEADSYTPPFYRGRALPSPGTPLMAEANAHFVRADGTRVPEEDIVYTWRVNGVVEGEQSGRGRAQVRLDGPELLGNRTVTVEAVSADNTFRGETTARVPVVDPYVALYEDQPAGGVAYHAALSSDQTLTNTEITIAAVPYYMDAESVRDDDLTYEWRVNQEAIDADPTDPNRIILSIGDAEAGIADIALSISHARHILQIAERSWRLSLTDSSGPGDNTNPFSRPTTPRESNE